MKKEFKETVALLRSVPSLIVVMYVVSVIMMNLFANKEMFTTNYLALDCGYIMSWFAFFAQDVICKHFRAKASIKITVVALLFNLFICLCYRVISAAPGNWGEYYTLNSNSINTALNNTFKGSWYILFGSSLAMLVSSIVNSLINRWIGSKIANTQYKHFAIRSFASTMIGQVVDNLVFGFVVSVSLFGWSVTQVITCGVLAALIELLGEVIFSPLGYLLTKKWEEDKVGEEYLKLVDIN